MEKNTMGKEKRVFGEHQYNVLQMSMESLSPELENDLLLKGRTLSLLRGNPHTGVFGTHVHK